MNGQSVEVYAHEDWEGNGPSIFLAGPSPRSETDPNWRPEALAILHAIGFKHGAIFVPLPRDGNWLDDYDAQIDWEVKYLEKASLIAFWIPRDLEKLPGFTTNVEYGEFLRSGKIILGYPVDAPKMRYLHRRAVKEGVQVHHTLDEMLKHAAMLAKRMCVKAGGVA